MWEGAGTRELVLSEPCCPQAPPPHLKMQPTATMATGATTTATLTLTTTWDNTTERPTVSVGVGEGGPVGWGH